jgi:hypothetical protein
MATEPSQTVRLWRRAPWSHNPLMRRTDRIESSLLLVVVLFVLMMGTSMLAAGWVDAGRANPDGAVGRSGGYRSCSASLISAANWSAARSVARETIRLAALMFAAI